MKPAIAKLGTVDIGIVESNPIVWKGKLYRFDYIRGDKPGFHHRDNPGTGSFFRFVNLETGETAATFGHGFHMGNAFVHGDRIIVTCVENWGKDGIWLMESADMRHWSQPRMILHDPAWKCYNTSICKSGNEFILTFELGAPAELVGVPFTMFFARSADLEHWYLIPDTVFGRDFYTGGPMLRYFAPWYYFFYLDGSYEHGFNNAAARSKDLKNWELAADHVLCYSEEDRKIKGRFSEAESDKIRNAEDINNSDLDMCEWNNSLFMVYSWGNQRGTEFLAEAACSCSEKEFCECWFEKQ